MFWFQKLSKTSTCPALMKDTHRIVNKLQDNKLKARKCRGIKDMHLYRQQKASKCLGSKDTPLYPKQKSK